MKGARKVALFTLILALLLTELPALAHVEKGDMPDSVAEMEYRILLEFKPEDTATRVLLGMTLLRQNKLAEAEQELRLILQTDPKNFDALDSLGWVLFKQKRYSEALPHLLTAKLIRPSDIMVHLHLGMALGKNNQAESAREMLASGLKILNNQQPSSTTKQQTTEFQGALAALPKKNDAVPRQ